MKVATLMSPIGLWTSVLKPRLWHFDRHHLVFLEPQVMRSKYFWTRAWSWGGAPKGPTTAPMDVL